MTDPAPISRSSDLRRRILDASRHLLVREGCQHLSMRRIARSIGYSATSIYLHFDDKDDLIHALIEEGLEKLYERLYEAYRAEDDDPLVRLEQLCRSFINFGLENPEYYEIMFLLDTAPMERYPAEKYRRGRRNLNFIVATLREATDQGRFTVREPQVAASAIWASLHGTVSLILSRRLDVQIEKEAFIDTAVKLVVRGIAVEARSFSVPG